jgi:cbb3-type cytochrome c oxidase subunit III
LRSSKVETRSRRSRAARAAAALALTAATATGCTGAAVSREGADTAGGKELFSQKCGQCHVLADAGTAGQTGPNLDDALGLPRAQGIEDSTLFEVTLRQMSIPAPPMPDFDDPDNKQNYLSKKQRVSIAAYVADVAGKRPKQEATDPKSIFTSSCGSCHTLDDAGTTGTVGPNLDDTKPGLERAISQITNGGGGMPAFQGRLSEEQIKALADYVVKSTG